MTKKTEIPDELKVMISCEFRDAAEGLLAMRQTPSREEIIEIAGHRLALDLECLILDRKDTAFVSKWFDQVHEALENWREAVSYNAGNEPTP